MSCLQLVFKLLCVLRFLMFYGSVLFGVLEWMMLLRIVCLLGGVCWLYTSGSLYLSGFVVYLAGYCFLCLLFWVGGCL